jgi:hypothetical protein
MITLNRVLRHLRGDVLAVLVLSGVFALSTQAQTAAPAVKQVPAGSTATIGPGKAAAPGSPANPQAKILNGALTPETRKTLQQAMDSVPSK